MTYLPVFSFVVSLYVLPCTGITRKGVPHMYLSTVRCAKCTCPHKPGVITPFTIFLIVFSFDTIIQVVVYSVLLVTRVGISDFTRELRNSAINIYIYTHTRGEDTPQHLGV